MTDELNKVTSQFGEFVKDLRIRHRISLRAFAEAMQMDPANYSKLERGKLLPPRDPAKLEPYRRALGLDSNSAEWRELLRLASIDRGEIPQKILNDKELVGKLPALFRTLEGEAIDESILDELIAAIRRE